MKKIQLVRDRRNEWQPTSNSFHLGKVPALGEESLIVAPSSQTSLFAARAPWATANRFLYSFGRDLLGMEPLQPEQNSGHGAVAISDLRAKSVVGVRNSSPGKARLTCGNAGSVMRRESSHPLPLPLFERR